VRICPNIAGGSGGATATQRFMLNGSNSLAFQLYRNAARTTIWGSYLWAFSSRPPTINLSIGSAGTGSTNVTIYGRVFLGQTTVPPGSYVSSFTSTDVVIRYRQGTGSACTASASGWLTGTATFTASATVSSICQIGATSVNFGTRGVLDAAVDATGTVTALCTSGTGYTLSLNGGLSGSPPAARLMTQGLATVTYGLYKDAGRTQVWGDAGTPGSTVSGSGNGTNAMYTVYGRVPAQTTPAAGAYSDTVVATVTY
jgi:spore coat protein U-like protein